MREEGGGRMAGGRREDGREGEGWREREGGRGKEREGEAEVEGKGEGMGDLEGEEKNPAYGRPLNLLVCADNSIDPRKIQKVEGVTLFL